MRNPSKNTIKKLMRQAKYAQSKGLHWIGNENYFLFNNVGARAYIMSKWKIDNRANLNREEGEK